MRWKQDFYPLRIFGFVMDSLQQLTFLYFGGRLKTEDVIFKAAAIAASICFLIGLVVGIFIGLLF